MRFISKRNYYSFRRRKNQFLAYSEKYPIIEFNNEELISHLNSLLNVIKHLRHPEHGCSWDLQQTLNSLKSGLIEETYEVIESIESENHQNISEELGDLLFLVLMMIYVSEQSGITDFSKPVINITEKLIRRHPHVFSGVKVSSSEDILKNWETIKQKENDQKNKDSILKNIPRSLPALQRLERALGKMIKIGQLKYSDKKIIEKLQYSAVSIKNRLNPETAKQIIYCLSLLSIKPKIKLEEEIHNLLNKIISDL